MIQSGRSQIEGTTGATGRNKLRLYDELSMTGLDITFYIG